MSEIFTAIGACESADRDFAEAREDLALMRLRRVPADALQAQERLITWCKLVLIAKVARLKWVTGQRCANG